MKFLTCQPAHWLHLKQLVVLLLYLARPAQSHAIAEASSEPTQDVQRLYPKQAHNSGSSSSSSSNLKWLIVRQSSDALPSPPHTQLEVPPPVDSNENQHQTSAAHPQPPTARLSQIRGANAKQQEEQTTPATNEDQRWIEKILINVDVMNLINERRRQQLEDLNGANNKTQEGEEDERLATVNSTLEDESPAGQAPTDSGEDLLEAQLDDATTLSSLSSTATAPAAVAQLETEDLRSVESNNVSSAIRLDAAAAAAAAAASSLKARENPGTSSVPLITSTSKQVITCELAYTQCALREVCAPTLKAYHDDCQDLMNNRTGECSAKCLQAMIALKSSEAGEDLANCDCQGNEFCQLSKQRSQSCQPQVDRALDPTSVVSCSVASSICMANQLCATALGFYYRRCQSMFSQRHCSERCNNSLTILHKQPQAMKLVNCQCDGSEEFPCLKYKTYTERLCLNRQPQVAPTFTTTPTNDSAASMDLRAGAGVGTGPQTDAGAAFASHFDGDSEDEDGQQAAATNEDDGINLTNDPSDLPALNHGARGSDDYIGGGGGGLEFNGDGGSPSDSDPSNANKYFFNGIQQPAVEDNWIPLVSGRYFTNLHQQQQRQQQQQHQRVKQPRKSSPRRTQKNARQKVRSNETRRRQSRPHMFALTSSATHQTAHPSSVLNAALSVLLSVILLAFL